MNQPPPPQPLWFDAHLDLAYLALAGRDLTLPLEVLTEANVGPHAPAAVTLPELAAARVRMALVTIYTEPAGQGRHGYIPGDADSAFRAGRTQLEVYLTWQDQHRLSLDLPGALRPEPGVGEVRAGMGVAAAVPFPLERRVAHLPGRAPLHAGILMENADPIRTPADLGWWAQRGLAAVGLTWSTGSRYAAGNASPAPGRPDELTSQGRDLAREIDRLDLIHDLSHLSDRAADALLELSPGRIMASHSNARALLDRPGKPASQRHLRDDHAREIIRRGGVIGLNLVSNFLSAEATATRRATLDDAVAHIEYYCELAGSHECVGLGSDLDGGFSAAQLPHDIDRATHLHRLARALAARGWTEDMIGDFAWRNFARFLAAEAKPQFSGRPSPPAGADA